jgi:hypothetical protein
VTNSQLELFNAYAHEMLRVTVRSLPHSPLLIRPSKHAVCPLARHKSHPFAGAPLLLPTVRALHASPTIMSARKTTFIAWCPDYTDADALTRRLAVRPAHLAGIHKAVEDGRLSALSIDYTLLSLR